MAYAQVQRVENSQAVTSGSLAAPSLTLTAGNTVIVTTSQNPASIATLTGTLGNTYILDGHSGIASFGKFTYYCQNSLAGPEVITGHTNGSDFAAIVVSEFSGLKTSGGPIGSRYNAINGPGDGTDLATSTTFPINTVAALLYGFCADDIGSFVPLAGTGFTGRGSLWANLTGGVNAITADRRITVGGSYAATFGTTGHGGDVYLINGIAFPELGAVTTGGGTGTGGPPGGKWSWMKRR